MLFFKNISLIKILDTIGLNRQALRAWLSQDFVKQKIFK